MLSSNIKGVILIGGPYNDKIKPIIATPLPLFPVGGKKIINHQIQELINSGADEIILFGSYDESLISAYCKDATEEFRIKFEYICEKGINMETGAFFILHHMKIFSGDIDTAIVTHCNLCFSISIRKMLVFHEDKGSMITVASKRIDDNEEAENWFGS